MIRQRGPARNAAARIAIAEWVRVLPVLHHPHLHARSGRSPNNKHLRLPQRASV